MAAPTALRECISQGTAGDAGLFLLNASNIIKVAGGCDGAFIATTGAAACRTGTGTIHVPAEQHIDLLV